MIKIRYACLPEGLHATAVARGRRATIYLRPGLEPWQRRDALDRLRRDARLGYAPPLTAFGLARALAADRISGTARNVVAALLCHPLGALGLAGMLTGLAVTYMAMVACPVPGGSPGAAGVLPAAASGFRVPPGGPAAGLAGAAALGPLGLKPHEWWVPEARPRRQAGPGGQPGQAVYPVRPRQHQRYWWLGRYGTGSFRHLHGGWQRLPRHWLDPRLPSPGPRLHPPVTTTPLVPAG